MDTLSSTSAWMFDVLQVVGTLAFAVSGAMAAIRKKMDWFGVAVLGVIVAVGGGTIRDLLLPQTPVGWVDDPWPVALATVTALAMIPLVSKLRRGVDNDNGVLAADAAGLAVFTVLGADVALAAGVTLPVAVLFGVITGTGGGVLRDLLAGRVPVLLTGQIYAVASLVGGTVYVVLVDFEVNPLLIVWIPVVLIFGLRSIALWRDWSLPTVDVDLDDPGGG
jgi:uncharacterized membrane protein YeiH